MHKVLQKLSGLYLLTVAVGLPLEVQVNCREVLSKNRVLDFKTLKSELNPTIDIILEQIQQIPP